MDILFRNKSTIDAILDMYEKVHKKMGFVFEEYRDLLASSYAINKMSDSLFYQATQNHFYGEAVSYIEFLQEIKQIVDDKRQAVMICYFIHNYYHENHIDNKENIQLLDYFYHKHKDYLLNQIPIDDLYDFIILFERFLSVDDKTYIIKQLNTGDIKANLQKFLSNFNIKFDYLQNKVFKDIKEFDTIVFTINLLKGEL